jgi:hypothetical protein
VARRWASGRGGSARPEDASDAATAALMRHREATLGGDDASSIEIGAGEADVVHLFFALDTQWLRAGMAGARVGLDYAKVAPTAELLGIAWVPPMFADLQMMERAALAEFRRK